MKPGFYTIMSAQFFSSLADNALLVAAIDLLNSSGAPAWHVAALPSMFALFYVLLAPFVGAVACGAAWVDSSCSGTTTSISGSTVKKS